MRRCVVLALVLLAGCTGAEIDPAFEMPDGASVVVVPFSDQDHANGFDSPRGTELAEKATRKLGDAAPFRVRPWNAVMALFQEGDPAKMTLRQVAEKCRADHVLGGHVEKWQLVAGGEPKGTARLKLFLYEAPRGGEKGRYALRDHVVTATYPDDASYDRTLEQIENGLVAATAREVSWVLVGHEPEEARPGR